MKFFQVYQYAAPLVLLPLSYWLWSQRYGGDHRLVLLALSLPVAFAYVIPAIGTNWLRLWEFNTRFRLGRFRPHHGLLFGAATSLFAVVTLSFPAESSVAAMLRDGFVLGSVLAFWNWLYDMLAIQAGFIKVYTRKQFEGSGAEAVSADYAPVLFGVFGFSYGVSLRCLEFAALQSNRWLATWLWPICLVVCLAAPVLAYVAVSYLRTGQSGLRSYERVGHEA
jgi:hypothetical protein